MKTKNSLISIIVIILLCSVGTIIIRNYSNCIYDTKIKDWPYNAINFVGVKSLKPTPIKVAIIDTGIDISLPCFKGINIKCINIVDEKGIENQHGNIVSSIICNNDILKLDNIINKTTFYMIKIGSDKDIKLESLIKGIKTAIELKVDIINISLGVYQDNTEMKKFINEALNENIIIVCASGNDSAKQYLYPASYEGVISVSSVDVNNQYLLHNNVNDRITVCAPGEKIPTQIYDNKNKSYIQVYGTSGSAAILTSVVILLKNINPRLDSNDIIDIIKNTSKKLDKEAKDEYYGYGLIDFKKAVLYTKSHILYKMQDIIKF